MADLYAALRPQNDAAPLADFATALNTVAFVGDRDVGGEAVNQLVRQGDAVALAGRADQAHWVAERVAGGVDFRAQAPARPPKALGIRPPHMGCFKSSSFISAYALSWTFGSVA